MKLHGIKLHPGSKITNANIDHGTAFPTAGTETKAQLFYRTDEDTLYIRSANNTQWFALGGGLAATYLASKTSNLVTYPGHPFNTSDVGAPLYFDGTVWVKAIANSESTVSKAVIAGIVDSDSFAIQQVGELPGIDSSVNEDGGSLIPGTVYYLSSLAAGKITSVVPSKTQISNPVYLAISGDTAYILNYRPLAPFSMEDLANVDDSAATGEVLIYDGMGNWTPGLIETGAGVSTLEELTDVYIPTPTNTQVLTYNENNNLWVASTPIIGAQDLDELDDVDLTGVTSEQVLAYDDINLVWRPTDMAGNENLILNDLTDVNVEFTAQEGRVLTFNSSTGNWEGVEPVGSISQVTNNVATTGIYSHDDGNSTIVDLDLNSENLPFVDDQGSPALSSTNVKGAILEIKDVADAALASPGAVSTVIDSMLTNGTVTHNNGDGDVVILDFNSENILFQSTLSPGLLSTNVRGALDELYLWTGNSENIGYQSATSPQTLAADNVRDAIDELSVMTTEEVESEDVNYVSALVSPSTSLLADNVRDAIDEITLIIEQDVNAYQVSYVSGEGSPSVTADNVRDAIDELMLRIDALEAASP